MGTQFSIGDKVLIKNPLFGLNSKKNDLLTPHNIIVTIIEICPGEMYKVRLPDGQDVHEKVIHKGQMMLYENAEDTPCSTPTEDNNDQSALKMLNHISEFAASVRESVY